MTEETLEQELFGGEYKVPQTEGSEYKSTSFTNFVALHSISRHKLRSGGAVVQSAYFCALPEVVGSIPASAKVELL